MLLLCCVFDTIALGIGVLMVLRLRWRGVRTELIGTVVAAALVFGAIGALTLHGGGFALMRGWAHVLFCVLLPLLALRAVRILGSAPRLAALWLTIAALGTGCYVWARRVEPFRLEVTTATVTSPRLQGLERPLRLAVVADLQTDAIGPFEVTVFDRLVELAPDLVLWLGDYLQLDAEAGAHRVGDDGVGVVPRHDAGRPGQAEQEIDIEGHFLALDQTLIETRGVTTGQHFSEHREWSLIRAAALGDFPGHGHCRHLRLPCWWRSCLPPARRPA